MAMFDWTNQPVNYNAGFSVPNMGMLQSNVTNGNYSSILNPNQPTLNDYIANNFAQSAGINPISGSFNPSTSFGNQPQSWFGRLGEGVNKNMGLINLGTGLVQGLMGFYQGNKSMNLLERQLNNQIRTDERNYQNQRQLVNSELADRQSARVASNANAYMGVDEYMKKYGV